MRRIVMAALVAAALGGVAVPARGDTPLASAFGPFTADPGNVDCIAGTDPVAGATRFCDPINIVFPGQSLDAVLARLYAAGWSNGSGTVQWLRLDGASFVPVDWQLGWADGPDPTQRYHVRLWQVAPNLTVGNVHHEHGTPHRIDMPWDEAESFLAAPLCSWWCQHLPLPAQAALQDGTGSWRGWPNDAVATVIPTRPPAATPFQPPLRRKHRKHRTHI